MAIYARDAGVWKNVSGGEPCPECPECPPVENANFTNGPTGTYTDGGVNYKYVQFNSSGTLTITTSGIIDLFMIGGGGYGYNYGPQDSGPDAGGGAGGVINRQYTLSAGTYAVSVAGAGGNSSLSSNTLAGNSIYAYAGGNGSVGRGGASGGGQVGQGYPGASSGNNGKGGGAGGPGSEGGPGLELSITGSPVTYGIGGSGYAYGDIARIPNSGNGGNDGRTGGGTAGDSGVVIIRVVV